MDRSSQRPAWLKRTAAIWRSDASFRIGLMVLAALLMTLVSLHT